MNIFLYELKAYRKFTISWTVALIGLVVFFLSIFPYFSREVEEFKKILEGFPETLRIAIGLYVESIGSILGFYSYIFLYISLLGAMQAMILATSILSKEARDKTADFLFTKPVTRGKILTAKLLAAFTSLIITNLFYLIGSTIMANLVKTKEFSIKTFLLLSLTLFFIQLIFLVLGIIISVVIPGIKSVISISLGTVFAFFFLGALVSTTGDMVLRYLTPFKYFDFVYIIQNSSYELPFLFVTISFIVLGITVSYFVYQQQDIYI